VSRTNSKGNEQYGTLLAEVAGLEIFGVRATMEGRKSEPVCKLEEA
jgi:hypothetical protein